jgi:hypothetical protein
MEHGHKIPTFPFILCVGGNAQSWNFENFNYELWWMKNKSDGDRFNAAVQAYDYFLNLGLKKN